MIVAGSGHRSRDLGTTHPPYQLLLVDFAETILRSHGNVTRVVSGMALGWDQALARAAVRMGVPFDAVIPFEGQESRWHSTDRAAYRHLMQAASGVQIVDTDPDNWRQAFLSRNEAMVDQADQVWGLWDGRKYGGTFHCLKYAHARGRRVLQLYQMWQEYFSSRKP